MNKAYIYRDKGPSDDLNMIISIDTCCSCEGSMSAAANIWFSVPTSSHHICLNFTPLGVIYALGF